MKPRCKKPWWIALLIAALLVIAVPVGLSRLTPSYSRILKANWGFELPTKALMKELYAQDSGASFHGDGVRYHVFSYRYEDYIDLMFAWSPNEPTTRLNGPASTAAGIWLDEIGVPEDRRPDYETCACWRKTKQDGSEILVFWDSEKNLLHIVENFL